MILRGCIWAGGMSRVCRDSGSFVDFHSSLERVGAVGA